MPHRKGTIQDLLLRLVICEPATCATGCWEWPGTKHAGYGDVRVEGRRASVHRAVYEHFVGPIPSGLQVDHLCRNRACANFEHLEVVTQRENILRGASPAAAHAATTQCPSGHLYDEANTRRDRQGKRVCRTCHREREKHRRANQKRRSL